jgi:hypothetical protein
LIAFSVAFKQLTPESELSRFIPLRLKHVPFLSVVLVWAFQITWRIIFGDTRYLATGIMATWGMYVSWYYLRFVQRQNNGRGDRAESFAFATLFPEIIQLSIFPQFVL